MAEDRLIEVGIISATNLKDVNYLSKMETYAVLTFAPYVEYTTQVDSKGGLNPRWGEKLGFLVPESVIQRGEANIKVEIFTLSTLGPKFVSEATIPLSDLSVLSQLNDPIYKRYPLKTNSGDYHGDLHVSFSLGEKLVLQQKGEHSYPIVTKFRPHASGPPTYDSQQPTSKPSHVRFNLGPSSTPTKPSKFTKPAHYESDDTQFQPSQLQPTTYFTEPPSSKTPPPTPPASFESPFPSRPVSKPHTLPENYETFPPSYPLSSKPLKPLPQPTPPYGLPFEGGDSILHSPIKPLKPLPQPTPPYGLPFEGGDSISYSPIKPLKPLPQPTPPYGPPFEGGDSISYSPIKSPRAPAKFGTHSVNVPISRIDEPTRFPSLDQSGYGYGADYPIKGPKFGTSRTNVPISKIDEESMKFPSFDQSGYGHATKPGYQVPTTSLNHLFGSPLGKILLTEFSKSMTHDRRY